MKIKPSTTSCYVELSDLIKTKKIVKKFEEDFYEFVCPLEKLEKINELLHIFKCNHIHNTYVYLNAENLTWRVVFTGGTRKVVRFFKKDCDEVIELLKTVRSFIKRNELTGKIYLDHGALKRVFLDDCNVVYLS